MCDTLLIDHHHSMSLYQQHSLTFGEPSQLLIINTSHIIAKQKHTTTHMNSIYHHALKRKQRKLTFHDDDTYIYIYIHIHIYILLYHICDIHMIHKSFQIIFVIQHKSAGLVIGVDEAFEMLLSPAIFRRRTW